MRLDGLGRLLDRLGLARQAALVNLESDGADETHVRWDSVSDGEGDQVSGDEGVGEEGVLVTISAERRRAVQSAQVATEGRTSPAKD